MTLLLGPDEVRKLRGSASRATFAKRVGVTPHTIYRWELPDGAKDARRPRGAELERLEQLQRGVPIASEPTVASSSSSQRTEDIADALGAIDRALRADWHAARAELLRVVTQPRSTSAEARALGASGLALVDVMLRADPRSALATLAPALHDAEEERIAPHAAAWVFATAACAHALPDATLFDPGRVHAHAARAEALAGAELPEAAFIAWLSTMHAAVMVADDELLGRAFARFDRKTWADLPPLLALHEIEGRAIRAKWTGQRALATKLTQEVIDGAAEHGYGVVEARATAHCALQHLDDLASPETALALARRSQQMARASRASMGVHVLFAVRAEAEALLRAGRPDEAIAALDELRAYQLETGLPPLQAVPAYARVCYLAGRYDAMLEVKACLERCSLPSLRPICRANALSIEAMHMLATSEDPEATVEVFERAADEAKAWTFLSRDVMVFGCSAHVVVGREGEARVALRRAQRALDRNPSPWAGAHLRRVEGTLAASHGHWSQGRQLLEAAIGTFESAGDIADAALARHVLAALADAFEEPEARSRLEESRAYLASLGLKPPAAVRIGVARVSAARRADSSRPSRGDALSDLVAPVQRLAVRGADPALVQRELVALTNELLPQRLARLEELDSNGDARIVAGTNDAPSSSFEWVEFGDGAGRRLRLGASGPLDEHARAVLAILGTTGGLALEVASLRSIGNARSDASSDDDADIPGLVAASASMRALRAQIAHLAASRATVVIHGESGTGKEVIARAIHDLSTRADRPYVAFNCAAVPRDLFEGQLFGYRRGAFTGAARDQPGVLRAAESGTIFLDEIGELPLEVQPKLLRFLENGEIFPLGDERPHVVDVRVIAATHRDLAALVRERRFREDLYYRLQVIALKIPPLRDRRDDIAPLARHFVRMLSPNGAPPVLAPDALAKLTAHSFPGNVRELRNIIERALAYGPAPRVLRAEHMELSTT